MHHKSNRCCFKWYVSDLFNTLWEAENVTLKYLWIFPHVVVALKSGQGNGTNMTQEDTLICCAVDGNLLGLILILTLWGWICTASSGSSPSRTFTFWNTQLTVLNQRHHVVKHKGECLNQAANCTPIQLCILVFRLTHMGVVTGETQEHTLTDLNQRHYVVKHKGECLN